MIQAKITLKDGSVIEISGPREEIERILALYPDSLIERGSTESTPQESPFAIAAKKAIAWAKAQVKRYVQPCSTPGCKYNYDNPGNTPCTTPNPRADDDDIQKENHEAYHPFWNFYCMRFVRTCYGALADYPKAEDMYQALSRSGAISTGNEIPEGALVFWHWSTFGHIGIYTGGAERGVLHTGVNPRTKTRGIRVSPLQDITDVLDGYNHYDENGTRTSYLGWAYPPDQWIT